jgi:chorismate mutase
LLKEEAAERRVERERVRKLKEEQKAQARMERQAELLVKKQAKALEAMRKDLNKAAKPAKLLRKAPIWSKIAVVVPQVEMEVSGTTSRGRAYRLPARYKN